MTAPVSIPVPRPLPAREADGGWVVDVDGVRVTLSNLDKPYWPDDGYVKGDLLAYYHAVAPYILPYLRDRPLTMKRMPDGISGDFFYAKQAPAGTPAWIDTAPVVSDDTGKRIDYLMANDTASLLHIANLGCIEMHPWHARVDDLAHPDYAFFDLDPFDVDFGVVRDVALLIKTVLDQVGLRGYARTSGATGMQVYVPVERHHTATAIRAWVETVCRLVHRADPGGTTMEWDINRRTGKVFLDFGMNTEGRNIAATYSVRPEPGAPVATPLTWDEVDSDIRPGDFTIASIWERLDRHGDLFAPVLQAGQRLDAAMRAVGMDPEAVDDTARHHVAGTATRRRRADLATAPGDAPDAPSGRRAAGDAEEPGDLSRYARMRDFTVTAEPAPSEDPDPSAGSGSKRFVIQHHLASRLHHDLRLERGGTARSWALPKGLPDQPGVQHLAVQTEDHPLEYMTFAGEIPAGEYGAGPVRIWDSGTYEPLEWTADKVTFALHGRRHRGRWHLFRPSDSDAGQWLVARRGAPEELPPDPPALRPMLAGEQPQPFDDAAWVFEPKWDGVRALATLRRPTRGRDGSTALVSRAGNQLTDGFPELQSLWERLLARNAVIDGEIIATDHAGVPSFQRLQQRLHVRDEAALKRLRQRVPVTFMAFDVLAVDGTVTIDEPWTRRRSLLEDVLVPGGSWALSRAVAERGTALYEAVRDQGLEGIVAKRADSTYQPGRRSATWLKIKVRRSAAVVIGGWFAGQGGREGGLGSLVVGAWDGGRLRHLGRVGTGFDAAERQRLLTALRPLARDDSPFVDAPVRETGRYFAEPELVCCVEYAEVTEGGRLRAPSYKGLLPDIEASSVVLEDLVGGG